MLRYSGIGRNILVGDMIDLGRPGWDFHTPVIDKSIVEEASKYDAILSLDYYSQTIEACTVHRNVFVMLNENIPDNPGLSPYTLDT
jgi:hypothetical protein